MANNPNAHTFSSSTVMSYASGGVGSQPQVYRASKSTRTGPGGVSGIKNLIHQNYVFIMINGWFAMRAGN